MSADLTALVRSSFIEQMEALQQEVRKLAESMSEAELWRKPIDPGNSVGHLILHLTGNLNYFVGAQLGRTGYVRDREREFTDSQPLSKEQTLANFAAAVATYRQVVSGLSAEQLAGPHPEARFGTVCKALVQILSHFALHRGQMSYIARLVKPSA